MDGFLVVVSCGRQKIWDNDPDAGPTAARDAYTSPVFKASRRYAEHFAKRWMILSAKYGFIDPDFIIPETYDRSFYDRDAISIAELKRQLATARLTGFDTVGVLGSEIYRDHVVMAFGGSGLNLRHVNGNVGFPPSFQQLISELIRNDTPFPPR
jgi:hypothetical protein